MANTAVAADFHQTSNVGLDFSAQVAFDLVVRVQNFSESLDLVFVEILDLLSRINIGLLQKLNNVVLTNPIEYGKGILRHLFARKVDTCNTCHKFFLTLSLLVLRNTTNHANDSVSLDDLALIADLFNACSHFHDLNVHRRSSMIVTVVGMTEPKHHQPRLTQ